MGLGDNPLDPLLEDTMEPTHVIVYYKYCGFKFHKSEPDFRFECLPIHSFNSEGYGVIYWRFIWITNQDPGWETSRDLFYFFFLGAMA
jgi:hypothetical protein